MPKLPSLSSLRQRRHPEREERGFAASDVDVPPVPRVPMGERLRAWAVARLPRCAAAVGVAAIVLALLIKTFLVQAFSIPSNSMQNTLQRGDRADFDGMLEAFPLSFHEPYYASYLKEDLPALFERAGLAASHAEPVFLSKLMVLDKA